MKKKIAIALCLSMALASFTACSGNSSKKDKKNNKKAETLFANSDARICMMTDFALENTDITWVDDEGNLLGCWWQLRTNDKYKSAAVMIWENGNIYDYGSYPDVLMGVRPAMWIDAN